MICDESRLISENRSQLQPTNDTQSNARSRKNLRAEYSNKWKTPTSQRAYQKTNKQGVQRN
jgi:hypothetical protein